MTEDTDPEPRRSATETRTRLLEKFSSDVDLLSLGSAVARVSQMASSEDEASRDLACYVLSDVALTQKLLRLANTVFYRTASGAPVSTISKAVFLLGFDAVRASALAMLLVESLRNHRHARHVRMELAEALCASLLGRRLGRLSHYQGAEEASIAALFKNLGRLLVASHEFPLYREIASLAEMGGQSLAQASQSVLGCTYDNLTESVLRLWNIPDPLVRSLAPCPSGPVRPSKSRLEWMAQVVCFSGEAAKLVVHTARPATCPTAQALLARFGAALNLDQHRMAQLFNDAGAEVRELFESLDMPLREAGHGPEPAGPGLPKVLQLATMEAVAEHDGQRHPSGKPRNARELLLAGVQDATQMMASGRCKRNELVLLVMETLYHSLGFRFAAVCMKDPKNSLYRAVLSVGEKRGERQPRFAFPSTSMRDVFHLAMENNADLTIADASDPNVRELLPTWHRTLLPDAKSFVVLPLVMQKVQLGLFYGDRGFTAPEGIPPDEAALVKALMGQMLAAINLR